MSPPRIEVFVQRAPMTGPIQTRPFWIKDFQTTFSSITELLKVAVLVAVVAFILFNWPYFAKWLDAVTHVEVFGAKIDRTAASEKILEIKIEGKRKIDVPFATAAVVRAEAVLPALLRARVLWVDGAPSNNRLERGVLEDMGINVQLALTTKDALVLAREQTFDLVISNMVRSGDVSIPLNVCRAAYFAFPSERLRTEYANDLNQFNAKTQTNPQPDLLWQKNSLECFLIGLVTPKYRGSFSTPPRVVV